MLTGPQNSADSGLSTAADRLSETRTRIAQAAARCGRSPSGITLLAVSKTQPPSAVRALTQRGQREYGENYLQEALTKIEALKDLQLTWHFIGQIQGNKTRAIAENFDWVHTVDRERIARRLSEQRPHYAAALNVCIQVSLESEPGKGGASPEALPALASVIQDLPQIRLRGLMCIPPPRESFNQQREMFQRLTDIYMKLRTDGFELDTLSMGMSADLEAAIAAGSTMVRVGTALFGERPRKQ